MRCDEIRLEDLLNEAETDTLDAQASAHLSDCARCQARLLSLAGDDTWWREAQDLLRAQQHDPPVASGVDSSILVALDSSLCDDLPATCESVSLDFLSPPSHPEMLGRLGRYEIESVIGSGGMGVVLRGFDTALHRPVAIKVLSPHLAGSGAGERAFARSPGGGSDRTRTRAADSQRGIQRQAALSGHAVYRRQLAASPNRPPRTTRDQGCRSGLRWKQRTDCPPPTLKALCIVTSNRRTFCWRKMSTACGSPTSAWHVPLTMRVSHARGFLRELPSTCLPNRRAVNRSILRSDLFSLGSVMYAMCTGRPPFRAETTMGVLRRISDDAPRPPGEINSDVPEWLETIILRLLAKRPG